MSPKAKGELAREHLDRALPAVTAEDYTEAVTWLFAALEAAIVAVAERHGIDTRKRHWEKAKAVSASTTRACFRTTSLKFMTF